MGGDPNDIFWPRSVYTKEMRLRHQSGLVNGKLPSYPQAKQG